MKIALIGYGKMGQMVEQLASRQGIEVTAIVQSQARKGNLDDADVWIDFSHPENIGKTLSLAIGSKKNIVIGTTGWQEQLEEVTKAVQQSSIGMLYSPNFSVGVHLFLKLASYASTLFSPHLEYDVGGYEIHHKQKFDSPSGTARQIRDIVEKSSLRENPRVPAFSSIRCGHAPGTHSLIFDSPYDSITLTHSARNREGFAQGALLAAKWLKGKSGVYTFDSVLKNKDENSCPTNP